MSFDRQEKRLSLTIENRGTMPDQAGIPEREAPMLNPEKIKIMHQMTLFEQKAGQQEMRMSRYYRTDYIRLQMLKTIVCVTVAYLLLAFLAAFYNMEYLISNAMALDYGSLAWELLSIYVLLLAAYLLLSAMLFVNRFDQSRKDLNAYYQGLKRLREMQREEEEFDEPPEGDEYYDDDL